MYAFSFFYFFSNFTCNIKMYFSGYSSRLIIKKKKFVTFVMIIMKLGCISLCDNPRFFILLYVSIVPKKVKYNI